MVTALQMAYLVKPTGIVVACLTVCLLVNQTPADVFHKVKRYIFYCTWSTDAQGIHFGFHNRWSMQLASITGRRADNG